MQRQQKKTCQERITKSFRDTFGKADKVLKSTGWNSLELLPICYCLVYHQEECIKYTNWFRALGACICIHNETECDVILLFFSLKKPEILRRKQPFHKSPSQYQEEQKLVLLKKLQVALKFKVTRDTSHKYPSLLPHP